VSTTPALTATPARSPTAAGFYVDGAGDGHGIGMSQYGALGFALHGFTYGQILSHYYAGTTLGTVAPGRTVTVLLRNGPAAFSGADRANEMPLNPATTYRVVVAGGELSLTSGGHSVATSAGPLVVSGAGPLLFNGRRSYLGSLVFRPNGSRVQTVNQLGLEDYVRGVIAGEMPSSWPAAALEAQAVAARTYALTAGAVNADFDLYDDTRSQMYGGVSAETPATDAAVAATANQIVEYDGMPATTYFFASSGGYTEDIQNVWVGVTPEAWLQGVPDPFDDSGGNPFYRWAVKMSLRRAARKLRGLYDGSFLGVRVLKHGVSPRVVLAAVVGTKGTTTVSGVQLQQALGLMSTYMKFTTITTAGTTSSGSIDAPGASTPGAGAGSAKPVSTSSSGPVSGGTGIGAGNDIRHAAAALLTGTVFPAGAGVPIAVQRLGAHGFTTIARGRTVSGGRYSVAVPGAGSYRVRVASTPGPVVTVS
jgi:stage II sporulation protein D